MEVLRCVCSMLGCNPSLLRSILPVDHPVNDTLMVRLLVEATRTPSWQDSWLRQHGAVTEGVEEGAARSVGGARVPRRCAFSLCSPHLGATFTRKWSIRPVRLVAQDVLQHPRHVGRYRLGQSSPCRRLWQRYFMACCEARSGQKVRSLLWWPVRHGEELAPRRGRLGCELPESDFVLRP
jgi:hypothetical protein